jgi:hypothetical protein
MRLRITTAFALTASTLLLALPAAASAARWQVCDNSGKPVGSVINGLNDAGSPCGWIRTGGSVVANIYRFTAGGFDGWMVSPGAGETPKESGILRKTPTRFTLGRLDGSRPVARAVKVAAGYWVLSRKANGTWTRAGSVRGGCKGAWAAGAARLLLWRK